MRNVAMLSATVFLMTSVAVGCGEHVTRSENSVQESTTYSSTKQGNSDLARERRRDSETLEHKRQTTTSDSLGGNMSTRENVTVEKKRSETASPSSDEDSLGSTQDYHEQSETFHQHTRTEVEK